MNGGYAVLALRADGRTPTGIARSTPTESHHKKPAIELVSRCLEPEEEIIGTAGAEDMVVELEEEAPLLLPLKKNPNPREPVQR